MTPRLRHKPKIEYCGLTIVLSTPSRFDVHELLSGAAGHFFRNECLAPEVINLQCDIRTSNTIDEGLIPGTKCILLLGLKAMHEWADQRYMGYSLGEQRGCPLNNKWNLPCIASFFPQDAMDMKDYESAHNPYLSTAGGGDIIDDISSEDDTEDEGDLKKKGKTKRSNFRFWLKSDTKKILSLITDTKHFSSYGIKKAVASPVIFPKMHDICNRLYNTLDEYLYIDIECHPETHCVYCIGFSFNFSATYVVPIFRYDGRLAYDDTHRFLCALAFAMSRNTVVCHNGFTFDLLVLANSYRIPFGRKNEDTMLMMHRISPEIEKSLGHCISLFTWEQYHKDEGSYEPHSEQQELNLWRYNAKDVDTMRMVHGAMRQYVTATFDVGLACSIEQANASIYAYVLNTLYGLCFEADEVASVQHEYDALMTQYLRLCRIAMGRNFLPSSSKDVPHYFHTELGYSIVARTKKGNPSLGKGALYKLKLKHPNNPIIDICLKYRQVSKASGSLKFIPWKLHSNSRKELLENSSKQIEIELS